MHHTEGGRKCDGNTSALHLLEKYQVLSYAEDPGDITTLCIGYRSQNQRLFSVQCYNLVMNLNEKSLLLYCLCADSYRVSVSVLYLSLYLSSFIIAYIFLLVDRVSCFSLLLESAYQPQTLVCPMRIMQGSPASPFLSSDSLVQYVFPFSVHMLSIMHDRVLQCLPGCSEISCNVK